MCERERERERERDRQTDTDRQTDRDDILKTFLSAANTKQGLTLKSETSLHFPYGERERQTDRQRQTDQVSFLIRSSDRLDLFVPLVRTSMTQMRSFASIGLSLWNRLPPYIYLRLFGKLTNRSV